LHVGVQALLYEPQLVVVEIARIAIGGGCAVLLVDGLDAFESP